MIDDLEKHSGHEIVDQYVMVFGEKKWFKYCRTCKCEVKVKAKEVSCLSEKLSQKEIDDLINEFNKMIGNSFKITPFNSHKTIYLTTDNSKDSP